MSEDIVYEGHIAPEWSPEKFEDAKAFLQHLRAFVQSQMIEGEHYGVIPGTGNKPTLFKPGAELLKEALGYSVEALDCIEERIELTPEPFFLYRYRCVITSPHGRRVGICEGSCNSRESKYAYRWAWPSEISPQERAGKETRIVETKRGRVVQYRIPNPNPYDTLNTVAKMAQKRAFVGAVLMAARASVFFTQDIEDFDESDTGATAAPGRLSGATRRRRPAQPLPLASSMTQLGDVYNAALKHFGLTAQQVDAMPKIKAMLDQRKYAAAWGALVFAQLREEMPGEEKGPLGEEEEELATPDEG